MHIKYESTFKEMNTMLHIRYLISEYKTISLIPDAPTPCNEYFHEKWNGVSLPSLLYHIHEFMITIPFNSKCPPETLTETAFEEQM